MNPLDTITELKVKYRSRKRVNGKWVYDYGEGSKKPSSNKKEKGKISETELQKTDKAAFQAVEMAEASHTTAKELSNTFYASQLRKAQKMEGLEKATINKLEKAAKMSEADQKKKMDKEYEGKPVVTGYFEVGDKVRINPNIDPELDPGRFRGMEGTIAREKSKTEYWVKVGGETIAMSKDEVVEK